MRETGLRLAWAGRERLGPRDRALLDATAGPNYPSASSYLDVLKAKQHYVEIAPDRADAWFELGDGMFHFGAVVGYPDADARAADAFKRALTLDSTYAPAAEHLLLIEAHDGDTTAVRQLGHHFLSIDPASENADGVRWRMAVALGDSASLADITRRRDTLTPISAHTMAYMSQIDAVDLDRAQRISDAAVENARIQGDKYAALVNAHDLALNRGRPAAAVRANARSREVAAANTRVYLRERVRDALYWDGDSAAAAAAVRELERTAFGPTPEKPSDRFGQIVDICNVELWRVGHDDLRTLTSSIARLRHGGTGVARDASDQLSRTRARRCSMRLGRRALADLTRRWLSRGSIRFSRRARRVRAGCGESDPGASQGGARGRARRARGGTSSRDVPHAAVVSVDVPARGGSARRAGGRERRGDRGIPTLRHAPRGTRAAAPLGSRVRERRARQTRKGERAEG